MFEVLPGLMLVVMITLTLILLPHLQEDRRPRSDDARRPTEEIHVKRKRE
jgi:hypothetical protein